MRPTPEYLATLTENTRCYIAELEQKVERLRGVVDKLPKTADGVPIVPGMRLWFWGLSDLIRQQCEGITVDGWYDLIGKHPTSDEKRRPTYSTCEAAATAGREGKGGAT